jgi:hypothetical protein
LRKLFISLVLAVLCFPAVSHSLPSFPGAQGWGSDTVGGRDASAKLYKVNVVTDSGGASGSGSCSGNICTGDLRFALRASGPRIVIFTTGGTITLNSQLAITNGFLTVAGQTAPGDGIQIKDYGFNIVADDIIIRGLRIRPGDLAGTDDSIIVHGVGTSRNNIVLDHNSLSWALDELLTLWQHPGEIYHDITLSWNIFSEGIRPGAVGHGVLIGDGLSFANPSYNISIHHNLIAHNPDRNPLLKGSVLTELINNVGYNWNWFALRTMTKTAFIGNHYIKGPNTTSGDWFVVMADSDYTEPLPSNSVYLSNNIGPGRPTNTGDEWDCVFGGPSGGYAGYRTNTPPFTLSNVVEDDVSTVKSTVLAGVGATSPLRDSVDTRVVNDVNNITGSHIASQSAVGGWPTLAAGTYPTDTDLDGMPDAWESLNGTDPNVSDWNGDLDGDGYFNIEEYINSFFETATEETDPPDIVNQSPAPNATGWLITDREVSFDVTDATGVDSSTLTFNIDGATNQTCAVGLTCTPAGDPTSLNVVYSRGADWNYEQTYTANVAVDDTVSPANSQSTNWQFTTEINPDIGPPVLGVHSPSTGQTGWVITNRLVTFDITDDIELVDTSVQFNVDGGTTQTCGSGLACSWIIIGKQLHLEYTHGSDWSYSTSYTLNIPQALDTSSNNLNTSWGFSTESAPPPPGAPSDIEIHIERP